MTTQVPTLAEIQQDTHRLGERQGWADKDLATRALHLISEVGELADELLSFQDGRGNADQVAAEMYDVIWNVCDLGRLLGIDLDRAAERKANENRERTW